MDLRIQKTKQSIFNAFIELRKEKPLSKITIKELVEKASISKQTFYLHYSDLYDLTEQIEAELIEYISADLPSYNNVLENINLVTIDFFKRALSQRDLYRIVFSDTRVSALTTGIEKKVKAAVFKEHPELRADLNTNIYLSFLIQGCYNSFQQYCTINVDEVVEILSDITKSITDNFHLK